MIGNGEKWERMGRILSPDPRIWWMSTFTGPAFADPVDGSDLIDVYVTGRDSENRSQIGLVRISLQDRPTVVSVSPEPVLSCGELGAFDENGVSYPCVVRHGGRRYLYYTGWMPTVLTPFQNHLGLAMQQGDGAFERVSRAPILERTDQDYLSIGSVHVQVENGAWRMWYTAFTGWGSVPGQPKHRYIIKYATSPDGIGWQRDNVVCIDRAHDDEHSICRPSVYRDGVGYHMWYCHRGQQYRIGYALSKDGITWLRRDRDVGWPAADLAWDAEAQCYPHVFRHGAYLYMLYCGNHYGRDGLGLARRRL